MAQGRREGNPGNKGGGRDSLKDALWHKEKWETDTKLVDLEKKIADGSFSIRDRALFEALKGNKEIIKKFMDKCLADLHDVRGKDGEPLSLVPEAQISLILGRVGKVEEEIRNETDGA